MKKSGLPLAVALTLALSSACHQPRGRDQPKAVVVPGPSPDAAAPPPVGDAAVADAGGADPSVNAKFKDPQLNVDEWIKGFEGESREVFVHRARILAVVGAQAGQTAADVGAGTGLFTWLLADAVGAAGRVFAVDVSPVFLRHIAQQAKRRRLRQVTTVKGTDLSTGLPEASVDRMLICDTYHHFENPQAMLASVRRALKRDGLVTLVDFKREDTSSDWTRKHVRAGEAQVLREWQAAGFELVRREDFLEDNYVLVFKPLP